MNDLQETIISYIRSNRISTTEVSDCLDKTGSLYEVKAVNQQHFTVGPVYWVYAYGESNWHVHEQIQSVPAGSIVIIEPFECKERSIIGDIVSKYLLLYQQCDAIVVMGNVRDASRLIKENWPIWSQGFNPVGCFNCDVEVKSRSMIEGSRRRFNNSIAVCDDTGVVVIEEDRQTEAFIESLHFIEEQEDIWYDCIDRKKWSTYDTICLKRYLKGED